MTGLPKIFLIGKYILIGLCLAFLTVLYIFLFLILLLPLFLAIKSILRLISKGWKVKYAVSVCLLLGVCCYAIYYFYIRPFYRDISGGVFISLVPAGIVCFIISVVTPDKKAGQQHKKPAKLKIGPRQLNSKPNYARRAVIFSIISKIFYCLAVICFLIEIIKYPNRDDHILSICFIFLGYAFYYYSHFCKRAPVIYKNQINEIKDLEGKPFVLYLREFKKENTKFYEGKYLAEFGDRMEQFEDDPTVNLETFISEQTKIHFGELTGLGDPTESNAHESAKMIYTADDWREKLTQLLHACRFIIMLPGVSDGIKFELEHIRSLGLMHKLYFLTKPKVRNIFDRYSNFLLEKIFSFFFKDDECKWSEFQELLNITGYSSAINPGYGSVIGVSKNGETTLLKTGCLLPSEYLLAIKGEK